MNKKFLILVAILAIAAMAFGIVGTGAWWTASDAVANNEINTGTLTVDVTGGPLYAANLEPGGPYIPAGQICVQNTGNINMQLKGKLVNVRSSDANLAAYVMVRGTFAHGTWTPLAWTVPNGTDTTAFEYSVTQMTVYQPKLTISPDDFFAPNEYQCWNVSVTLAPSAGNGLMGDWLLADFQFDAAQPSNTGW